MKNQSHVKIEGAFDSEALRILRSIRGVDVVATEKRVGAVQTDAVIQGAGRDYRVVIEVKRYANAATAHQLASMAKYLPRGNGLVLLAGKTTADARHLLEEEGIGVIDGLGNVHVELPGLLLHLEGRRDSPLRGTATEPPTRLTGKAGTVAQALLLEPERQWKVADLAGTTGTSTGLAHRVLARLEREGLLLSEDTGPRRTRQVRDPAALLDLWAEEAVDRRTHRLKAFRLSREPRNLAAIVSEALQKSGIEHAVTGPAAALRLAPFVTAVPVTDVWVTDTVEMETAAEAAGAELVDSGHNLVLAQSAGNGPLVFRTDVDGISVVNRFRLYRDLLFDHRRGREQAERLRKEVIGF